MRSLAILTLVLLSGCASTINRFGTATMEADPTEIGAESIVLQNELSRAYTEAPGAVDDGPGARNICRYTQPSFQEQNKHAYSRHSSGGIRGADLYRCVYLKPNPELVEVKNHLLAGLALSDLYCDTYFRRIARRWNERLFLRNTTNDVGAAISAILGLAKAGSAVTGGVGTAFGLADGAFRNYDNVFVVSPDLAKMQDLVKQHQKKLRTEVLEAPPTDYYTAQSRIFEYASLCSYTGMKNMLTDAVDETINQLKGSEGIQSALIDAATAQSAQAKAIAERAAANKEAELAARKREKDATAALTAESAPAMDQGDTPAAAPMPVPEETPGPARS